MPDSISVTPLNDPMQTMSGILGIQQKKQALQTGQYTQSSAQAASENDQMSLAERKRAAAYISNPANKGKSSDDMQDDIMSLAPTTGADIVSGIRKNEQSKLAIQSAATKLSDDNKTQAANFVRSLSGGQHTPDQVHAMTNAVESINPQLRSVLEPLRNSLEAMPPPGPQRDEGIARFATMLDGKSGTTGGLTDTGPTLQPTKQDSQGNIVATGKPIKKDLAPTQQIGYQAASAGATADASHRATGVAGSDIDRGNQVSAAVAPANQTITITKEIDDLADQVHSGKITAAISKAAASVGLDGPTYARQLLEKDLGRLKATATAGAGSDQRQATVLAGFPEATSDNTTIHTAMDYTRGAARQDLARGALLNQVKDKDPSLRGFQHADDTLTSRTDPLMHEFQSLKDPQQQAEFYKRNFTNRAQAQEFRDKVAGMGHVFGQ